MTSPATPPIKTPCTKVCAVDGQTGLCLGCGRTLREIGGWSTFTPDERESVMAELDARMDRLKSLGKLG
ncbi:MAG: DUF1289 domain-containing protein [Henriciella sp.]|jgi:predicted Fe-S protein YdhL (DUF1289 family)|uniref:DUF1289 domain-containing protein n=1 Tax=Henriciella sp. TaxID=1968823 RepID=UPI000C10262D|nr:DUF1289 domain-containing protein [Henriciella sp.]MAN73546.1 DUF1289 domain-containing protein [Henriciella sp.]MBF34715.1 DUF1289 domain-containing protein [Hyphomonadaceae bacterium]PHR71045.1 MAG: DUF1289 domain-containing protein [Henriciella sp.]|tara:strand:- start:375 stop:581 length:207 start_codon:yes stop_codon:yes gene_type:complete